MDPVTIAALLSGGGVFAVMALLLLLRKLTNRPAVPPALPPAASSSPPELPEPDSGEDKEEKEDAGKKEEEKASPPAEKTTYGASEVVSKIVENVSFSAKKVYVGERVVDQRSLGFAEEEVPYPADDIDVRPMMDPSEIGNVMPEEMLGDEDVFLSRVASSEAMVIARVERKEIFEDVYEEVWEERKRILYVLLDISWSMFPERGGSAGIWRPLIWRPLIKALLWHAVRHEVIFLSREFCGTVSNLRRAVNSSQAETLEAHFTRIGGGNSTDIPRAVAQAMKDFTQEDYNEGEIVIVTDGEDNRGMDPAALRRSLDEAGIRLYSILLGVENQGLRTCSDSYQIVEGVGRNSFVLQKLVKR